MLETAKQIDTQTQLPTNQPCWWMLAGVVDYKLCDRAFDCEHCPFDLILHGGAPRGEAVPEPLPSISHSLEFELVDTLFYHPAHVWVRVEDGGNVRVGLDDFGQKILGRAYAVSLPRTGTQVESGKHVWSITHKAGETSLVVPLTGVVIQVNNKLGQCPSLLNREPYGSGWAFMIKPTDLETGLGNLFYGMQARDWHRAQTEKLYLQASTLSGTAAVAGVAAMPDGGSFRRDFLSELSAEQMLNLISSFLPDPCGTEKSGDDSAAILNLKRR